MDQALSPLDAHARSLVLADTALLQEETECEQRLRIIRAQRAGIAAQRAFLKLDEVTLDDEIAALALLSDSVADAATEAGEGGAASSPAPEPAAHTAAAGEGPSTPSPAPFTETSAIPAGKGEAVVATGGLSDARPKTLRERVTEFVNAHPHQFTAREVAEHFPDDNPGSVLAACSYGKLPVRKVTEQEVRERALADLATKAPQAAPAHYATERLFWLRGDDGSYLMRNGRQMTTDPEKAWKGTEGQLFNVRRNHDIARGLREEVVPQQQVAA